jgi:hypothetical protein
MVAIAYGLDQYLIIDSSGCPIYAFLTASIPDISGDVCHNWETLSDINLLSKNLVLFALFIHSATSSIGTVQSIWFIIGEASGEKVLPRAAALF